MIVARRPQAATFAWTIVAAIALSGLGAILAGTPGADAQTPALRIALAVSATGYVIAVEYGFYAFFALCLLCIVSLFLIEKFRIDGDKSGIATVERTSRGLFLTGFAIILLAACVTYIRS